MSGTSRINGRLHNGTDTFYEHDEQKTLDKHIKKRPEDLRNNGWLDDNNKPYLFDYTVTDGFRNTLPIKPNPKSAIAVGCSCTFGIGMPQEHIWPTLLSKALDQEIYNLGVPAGSLDTVFRVLNTYIPKILPETVYLQAPSDYRRELIKDDGIEKIGNWTTSSTAFLLHPDEIKLNKRRQLYGIIALCQRYQVDIVIFRSHDPLENNYHNKDFGRDLLHPGYIWHRELAKHMANTPNDIELIYEYMD